MSTIQWVLEQPTWGGGDLLPTGVLVVKWPTMASGDVGATFSAPAYADKNVSVGGTFGSGGTLTIEGNDDPTGTPRYSTLADSNGNALTFNSAKGNPASEQILENPFSIRPNCAVGDGTTSLTVRMVLNNPARR